MTADKPMLSPGPYVLSSDVRNPQPDRRKTRDWRCFPIWKSGSQFVVVERTHIGPAELAGLVENNLTEEQMGRLREHNKYTAIQFVDARHPSLHEVGPGRSPHDEARYAALAAALIPVSESLAQFMIRIGCDSSFADWLVETGRVSREQFAAWWSQYQHGDTP